jgi:hypothetical protein
MSATMVYRITIEKVEGEVTEQMRAAYKQFWDLVIGRAINKSRLKPQPTKITTKDKTRGST